PEQHTDSRQRSSEQPDQLVTGTCGQGHRATLAGGRSATQRNDTASLRDKLPVPSSPVRCGLVPGRVFGGAGGSDPVPRGCGGNLVPGCGVACRGMRSEVPGGGGVDLVPGGC